MDKTDFLELLKRSDEILSKLSSIEVLLQGKTKDNIVGKSHNRSVSLKKNTISQSPKRLLELITNEGYFKQKREIHEIQKELRTRGYVINLDIIRMTLLRMIRASNSHLKREDSEKGYVYYEL